jgi:hypothetical protein
MFLIRKWLVPPTLTMAFLGSTSLAGPFSHQRNQLPGPRAAAMGGAFVAIADDPSAVYWNPAGYSLIDRPEVSVSGIGLIQSSTTYDETVSDKPFVERAQSLSPGFFGASIRNGRFGAGYGFAALDERNVNQNDSFLDVPLVTGETVDYYRTYQESSTLSSAGAGMSWLPVAGLSIGVSGAYYRRQSAVSNFQSVSGSGDAFTTRNLKYETLNEGLLGTAGALLVSGRFRAGLSYRYPFPISNNTTVSNSVADSPGTSGLPGSENQLSSVEGKSDDMDEPGIRTYQLGLAWGVPGEGIVSVDLVKHATGKAEEGRGLQTTWNYSAGFEAGLGGLVLRGGMFSNTSLYPAPVAGKANQPTAIDYSGISWGVGFAQKSREIAVTYVRQSGSGTAQLVADSYETQKVRGSLENLLLSSRVFF